MLKKRINKFVGILLISALACFILMCIKSDYTFSAQNEPVLSDSQITMNANQRDIRVLKNGQTSIRYTAKFKEAVVGEMSALGSAFFYLDIGKNGEYMTYNSDATCNVGALDRNDIMTSTKPNQIKYLGNIRIMKAGINNLVFYVDLSFSKILKTKEIKMIPVEFYGKPATALLGTALELNYVEGLSPYIIVQKPVTVKIKGANSDTSVKLENMQNKNNETVSNNLNTYCGDEYSTASSRTDVVTSGYKFYVDSGTNHDKVKFKINPGEGLVVSKILANGKKIGYSKEGSEYQTNKSITENTEMEIEFKKKEYKIVFDKNLPDVAVSNMPKNQNIKYKSSAKVPTSIPTASGYRFLGWYEDEKCTNRYSFEKEVTESRRLYAKWVKTYTVEFYTEGGSNVPTQIVDDGECATKPASPKKIIVKEK